MIFHSYVSLPEGIKDGAKNGQNISQIWCSVVKMVKTYHLNMVFNGENGQNISHMVFNYRWIVE